jgi:hypothetical protein
MPLTDFVSVDLSDAERVGDSLNPSEEFGGVPAKGISQVHLGTLHALLAGTPYDPDFMMSEDSFLYTGSDDGPWVQAVPQDLVSRLANLGDKELVRIAGEWAKTEVFGPSYSNWSLQDIQDMLRELVALSKRATSERKAVLMWTSL